MFPGSVTMWLQQLREHDPDAPRRIWDRYYAQVVRLARTRLRGVPMTVSDEEDVATAAFHSFFRAIGTLSFQQLDDRSDLWQILVTLTCRKAVDYRRREAASRRGGSISVAADCEAVFQGLAGREPDPQFAVAVAEELTLLIERLPDDDLALRRIASLKLEGHRNEEIGEVCQCSLRTVERRLCLIRKYWESKPHSHPIESNSATATST